MNNRKKAKKGLHIDRNMYRYGSSDRKVRCGGFLLRNRGIVALKEVERFRSIRVERPNHSLLESIDQASHHRASLIILLLIATVALQFMRTIDVVINSSFTIAVVFLHI